MAFPSNDVINAELVSEAGRIEAQMSAQAWAHDKQWSKYGRRGEFPRGMNSTINHTVWERSIPASAFQWQNININTGGSNNANPTAVTISPASDQYSYTLQGGAINSDAFSIHDAYLSLNFPEQLANIVSNLMNNALDIWEDRWQDEYTRIAGHKMIATNNLPEAGYDAAFPSTPATSQVTMGLLTELYWRLMADGGAEGLPKNMDMPTPYVFLGWNLFQNLKKNSTVTREGFQYAFMGSGVSNPLINPLSDAASGRGTYNQFDFKLLQKPARWDFVNGEWVRRPFYLPEAANQGTKAVPNPAYRTAQYEDTYIFHPNVMEMLMYDPLGGYSNGVAFDSTNFYGRFKYLNIPDLQLNPDGNTGFFRALFASAGKARLVNLGYVVRGLSCPNDFGFYGCSQ